MTLLEEFLGTMNPKLAKEFETAAKAELIRYPVASIGLTHALGGGIGAGRVITIYGNQSAGKSMLMLQSIGLWQKQGLVCCYCDVEATYDKKFSAKLGVDNDQLLLIKSKSSGQLSNRVMPLIRNGIDIVVIDSISDVMPEVFLDKDGTLKQSEDRNQMAQQAKAITKLISDIHFENKKTAVILLSQTTTKMETWGAMQVPHGGQKTLFGSSQIVRLASSNTDAKQKKGTIMQGSNLVEQPIGRTVEAIVQKNKMGSQSRKTEYDIYYAGDYIGIDRTAELIDLAVDFGVIEKGGSWFTYKGERTQGRDTLVENFKFDTDLFNQVKKELDEAMYAEQ